MAYNTPSLTGIFKDIDMTFAQNIKGDIAKVSDLNAVKQSVKNIVMIRHIGLDLFWGPGVQNMLFENFDPITLSTIQDDIEFAIRKNEPRVSSVKVSNFSDIDNNLLNLTIYFKMKDSKEVESVNIVLEKIR